MNFEIALPASFWRKMKTKEVDEGTKFSFSSNNIFLRLVL